VALVTMSLVVLTGSLTSAQPVHARVIFELPAVRLFPSERFTVADVADNTGRRMVMCLPESVECPAGAHSLAVLNALHGFNFRPRRSIPSVGPTVFLIVLLGILASGNPGGIPLGILNQVACDTFTHTPHVDSDGLRRQKSGYALAVTRRMRDGYGAPGAHRSPALRHSGSARGIPLTTSQFRLNQTGGDDVS
jgi:hypothetical protein